MLRKGRKGSCPFMAWNKTLQCSLLPLLTKALRTGPGQLLHPLPLLLSLSALQPHLLSHLWVLALAGASIFSTFQGSVETSLCDPQAGGGVLSGLPQQLWPSSPNH